MIVTDSPSSILSMSADTHSTIRPAHRLRLVVRAFALRLLEWSEDHSSSATTAHARVASAPHPGSTASTPDGSSPTHALRIRRHHQQRALEAERDRATARAHMGPLSLGAPQH